MLWVIIRITVSPYRMYTLVNKMLEIVCTELLNDQEVKMFAVH